MCPRGGRPTCEGVAENPDVFCQELKPGAKCPVGVKAFPLQINLYLF